MAEPYGCDATITIQFPDPESLSGGTPCKKVVGFKISLNAVQDIAVLSSSKPLN